MDTGNTVSGGLSLAAAQTRAEKKKPRINNDFYRFQAKEKKKNELVDLQQKFQDAQKRLQSMRAARKSLGT
jgi:ribosomal RNA-processing protein 7